MPNLKPTIPYPSRRNDERRYEKANDQIEKFYEIFKNLSFEISLTDALIHMPKFASTLKALIGNKEKLSEMARTLMDECLALADLGASINLMPLSVWKRLSLPELTPTYMTLKLADRSITQTIGIAEDVYVKVGKFHFPANFVVVDFDADPRVPLILKRSFLKTGCALIDVYKGELTLCVGKEAVTFNLDQTLRYSANYDDMTANQIDVIELAYEEYSQEVLGFSDLIASGNPTPYYDPIISTSSPTLTPFGDSAILNSDPSPPPPNQGNYLPEIRKELKVCEAKSSIDEPPEVKLKDLPPHLEYTFLEGDDKFPIIIAKDLSIEEKAALIKVLKSRKRAIAWKLFDKRFYKNCLSSFGQDAQMCEANTIFDLNWEKSHFMVKEGIVLGHKISKNRIEVDKAKVDVIVKLPHPTTIMGVQSFLGHAGFYRRFIQDFSKIVHPMTHLLEKETPFFFSKECIESFNTLKRKLTEAPILIAPDWDLPFELMCDASDFAIGAVLGQRKNKHFQPIHYASKTMTEAQAH
ncbi:reverse transcriptase domain-containing protein [Tanacetum coccineum]